MTMLEYSSSKTIPKNQHYRMVHNCKKCIYSTKSYFYIRNHVQRHKKRKPVTFFNCSDAIPEQFFCNDCNFATFLTTKFKIHLKTHKPVVKKEDIKTEDKKIIFETNSLYYIVKQSKPNYCKPKEMYRCELCSYTTFTKYHLPRHKLAVHTFDFDPVEWFSCDQCLYRTKFKTYLAGHKKRMHTPLPTKYPCDQCPFKFKQLYYLQRHKNLIHQSAENIVWFQCEHCTYKSRLKKCLEFHHIRKHQENTTLFHCHLCDYKAPLKGMLLGHMKKHFGEYLHCEQCSFKTKYKKSLRTHVNFKHAEDADVLWFRCDQCSYKGKTNLNLRQHVLFKHTPSEEVDWFHCDKCPGKFKLETHLRKHKLSVHVANEDKVKCDKCGFRTKCLSYLKRHEMRKHGEKVKKRRNK